VNRFRHPREGRIRKTADFDRVYSQRQRLGDQHLLVFAAPNDVGRSRCGISVSRKHGNAVERTRLKRLLRAAFRLSQHDVPAGLDMILIPRQGSGAGLDDYRRSVVRLSWKLAHRLCLEDAP